MLHSKTSVQKPVAGLSTHEIGVSAAAYGALHRLQLLDLPLNLAITSSLGNGSCELRPCHCAKAKRSSVYRKGVFLNLWRRAHFAAVITAAAPECLLPLDSAAKPRVPPIVASALCIKPRGLLTAAQREKVDDMKQGSSGFADMRALAMHFRGLLRSGNIALLDTWLGDAASSGLHAMRQFAATLRRDLGAVRNAMSVVK